MKYLQNGGLLLTKKFPSTFYAIYEMIENYHEVFNVGFNVEINVMIH